VGVQCISLLGLRRLFRLPDPWLTEGSSISREYLLLEESPALSISEIAPLVSSMFVATLIVARKAKIFLSEVIGGTPAPPEKLLLLFSLNSSTRTLLRVMGVLNLNSPGEQIFYS
jgi:hypothetical protein